MHTYEKILEALGEASMCWSETPQGVFDSTKGIEIAKKLYEEILKEKSGNLPEANRNAVLADVQKRLIDLFCELYPKVNPKKFEDIVKRHFS